MPSRAAEQHVGDARGLVGLRKGMWNVGGRGCRSSPRERERGDVRKCCRRRKSRRRAGPFSIFRSTITNSQCGGPWMPAAANAPKALRDTELRDSGCQSRSKRRCRRSSEALQSLETTDLRSRKSLINLGLPKDKPRQSLGNSLKRRVKGKAMSLTRAET